MKTASDLTQVILEAQNKIKSLTPEERIKYTNTQRKDFELKGDLPPHKTFAVINTNTVQMPKVILRYWMPALSEAELKPLAYLTDKTFGYDKDEGDAISQSQMIEGTRKKIKDETGRIIEERRTDWGVGLKKDALIDGLAVLEILGLIKVIRRKKENSKENDTNLYKVQVYEEFEEMSVDQRRLYMGEDPFQKVLIARNIYQEIKKAKRNRKVVEKTD